MADDSRIPTLKLTISRDGETLAEHAFTEESITIGRSDAALLVVEDERLADMHAVLNVEDDGSVQLLDLGAGEITLRGAPLESNSAVADGDEFTLAGLTFRLAIAADAEDLTTPVVDVRPEADDAPAADQAPSIDENQAIAAAEAADPHVDDAAVDDTPAAHAAASADAEGPHNLEDVLEFVLRSGTGAGTQGLETKKAKVLEVNQIWTNVLMETKHFNPGTDVTIGDAVGFKWSLLGVPIGWVPKSTIGALRVSPPIWSEVVSDWRNDFYASDDELPGGATEYTLFVPQGKGWAARVHKDWDGFIDRGGARTTFAELIEKGEVKAEGDTLLIPIDESTRLLVEVGGLIFFAHMTFPGKRVVVPFAQTLDYPFLGTFLFCALMGAILGVVLATADKPPESELNELDDRFVELLLEKPPPEEKKNDKPDANPDAGEGAKAKKEEGKTGKKDAKMKEAKGNKREIEQAQRDREIAENAGLLGAMDDMGDNSGVFGSGSLSSAVTGGIGGLIGAKGTQIGSGGLGSRGSGFGGGGTAEGLGGLGTKGIGSGKSGFGSGGGSFGAKGSGGISAASGDPIIMGALDRSLIDEVIKRKMNQIKYCYQRELQKDPSLAGKLVIKFTIAGNGSVSKAAPSTSMGNPAVDKCVVDRFYSMQFPEPKGGGIVIVSYPFLFSPG